MSGWEDLADDELVARLLQRGAPPAAAEHAVENRDDPRMAEIIEAVLGR